MSGSGLFVAGGATGHSGRCGPSCNHNASGFRELAAMLRNPDVVGFLKANGAGKKSKQREGRWVPMPALFGTARQVVANISSNPRNTQALADEFAKLDDESWQSILAAVELARQRRKQPAENSRQNIAGDGYEMEMPALFS